MKNNLGKTTSKAKSPGRVLLLAGGRGSDSSAAERALAELISGLGGKRHVACIGAANGDEPRFSGWMSEMMGKAGAGKVELVKTVSNGNVRRIQSALEKADLVFVSGGDVEAGMKVLNARGLVQLLNDLHAAGKPFCGVSAGSIMLAREWVRWRDPDDDSTAERFDCIGIAPVRIDTHGEADGWQELIALLKLCPQSTNGYGLRSGSAIEVDGKGKVRVAAGVVDVYEQQDSSKPARLVQEISLTPGPSPADGRGE